MTFEKLIFTEANGRSEYQFFKSQLNHIFTETKDSNCFIPYSERNVCNGNYKPKPIVHQSFFYQNSAGKSTRRYARWISFFRRWICLFIQNPIHIEKPTKVLSIWNNIQLLSFDEVNMRFYWLLKNWYSLRPTAEVNISFSKVNKTPYLPKQKTVIVLFHIPREENVFNDKHIPKQILHETFYHNVACKSAWRLARWITLSQVNMLFYSKSNSYRETY